MDDKPNIILGDSKTKQFWTFIDETRVQERVNSYSNKNFETESSWDRSRPFSLSRHTLFGVCVSSERHREPPVLVGPLKVYEQRKGRRRFHINSSLWTHIPCCTGRTFDRELTFINLVSNLFSTMSLVLGPPSILLSWLCKLSDFRVTNMNRLQEGQYGCPVNLFFLTDWLSLCVRETINCKDPVRYRRPFGL